MLLYEIYIRSFNSSTEHKIGDINGITAKLEYLKQIGVDLIWITPFYPSPMIDNGYDISDYLKIDTKYGTLEDFHKLIEHAHQLGMKIIIDVVLNHSSDQHQWFKDSINKKTKYADYYIWADQPLNDWESMFKGSAWTYNDERKQYYLHRFAKEQPDLNWLNQDIYEEALSILKYWAKLGVDGFRFDVINFLITDINKLNSNGEDNRINHEPTLQIIKRLKHDLKINFPEIIFIGEVGSEDLAVLKSYEGDDYMDYVFCFNISAQKSYNLPEIIQEIKKTKNIIKSPTILFSSHDMPRFNHRLAGYDFIKYKTILTIILFTTDLSILYQGDELFLKDYEAKNINQVHDIQALNEYQLLINENIKPNVAFEKALLNSRDFSRELIDWSNTHLNPEVQEILMIRNTFLKGAVLHDLAYDEVTNELLFTYDNQKIVVQTKPFKIITEGIHND